MKESEGSVYQAIFKDNGEAFEVSFPDLAGIFTFGETYADAIRMAHDALTQYLLACAELGIDPPEPPEVD